MQQRCVMPQQTARLFCKSQLSVFSTLILQHAVTFLLLTHSCGGQPQPIVAKVGDDITLPCHMKPARDAADEMLEWSRPDLNPRFVHLRRSGEDRLVDQNPSYEGRTSVSVDRVKQGDVSLSLSKVKVSDEGKYRCFVPALNTDSTVQLVVVGAASSPVLTLAGVDKTTRGVVLQCESPGWYPEPEVLWLDGEGNVLSAGPTETVRGPDDLYTVSSRVTVEKRHSNSFSCRVQQKNINQTRETTIHVPDEFFQLQSSCGVPIITAVSVCLAVCILIILFLLFFVWKQKQNKIKTKRERGLETEMKDLKGEEEKKSKDVKWPLVSRQNLQDEQHRREEAEKRVHILEEKLQTETRELEDKEQVNIQWKKTIEELKESKNEEISQLKKDLEKKLQDERNKREEEVKTLKKEQENKVELLQQQLHDEKIKREEAEKDLKEFEKKLQDEKNKREKAEKEVKTQKKELENKVVLLQQQLHDEKIKREKADEQVKNLKEKETELNKQLWFNREKEKNAEKDLKEFEKKLQDERNKREKAEKELKILKDQETELNKQLCEEKKKEEEAQRDLKELLTKNTELEKKLQDERNKMERAEKDVKILKDKETELEKKLQDERNKMERAEKDVKNLKKELETKVVLLQQQLHDEKIKREEAEKEVKILKEKETELEKKFQDERIKRERAEKNNEPSGHGPTEEETQPSDLPAGGTDNDLDQTGRQTGKNEDTGESMV